MSIVPNSTPLPHIIIREWMPLLKDIELRIVLVVADQTLGWIEDFQTGRRKEKDWISHTQLRYKIRRRKGKPASSKSVTTAVARLVDEIGIIQALDDDGKLLDSPQKRMLNGGKINYRLNLTSPQLSLFENTPPVKSTRGVVKKYPPTFLRATKETEYTKEINLSPENLETKTQKKKKSKHQQFIDFWWDTVPKTRSMKPVINKVDGANLKRVLKEEIDIDRLEQAALFFLADPSFKEFSPTIQTFTSSGILNGVLNKMKNSETFWKQMDRYMATYLKPSQEGENQPVEETLSNKRPNSQEMAKTIREMLKNLTEGKRITKEE